MFEIDMLPVESSTGPARTKSGDAIALRFTTPTDIRPKIVIIDGGYRDNGKDLVDHIRQYYDTNHVDLVISTHPDNDHISGLLVVLDELDVDELLIHQPRLHVSNVSLFSNIETVDAVLALARQRGVKISSPFTGLTRFDDHLLVLGPTQSYYEQLVLEHLIEAGWQQKAAGLRETALSHAFPHFAQKMERTLFMPEETLTDNVTTGPRNNTSVITLLRVGDARLLFTADAGIPALEAAADHYETTVGDFGITPLSFMQVPHHGSRHNVGPSILDRILGPKDGAPFAQVSAVISSAAADPGHPNPKVVNAFTRRGCYVVATEGRTVCHTDGSVIRPGWGPVAPLPALDEHGDDDA
ncbi:ComEC/Rec2 family competence protein [Pseudonocardia sp. RS010]|uniref:ComEC/Rec2 family competence protein n=1 Tax=Pseudonocardia sp. RS010 TaxID=3385979 RepID=UPI0039A1654A